MKKTKLILDKNSMPLKTDKPILVGLRQVLLFLLSTLLLAGCASKPWTEPLAESEAESVTQLVDSLVARDAACGQTLTADVDLFYQSPLEKKAMSGFLQFSIPSSYKFVMTNPFGQPILVISGNQDTFQAINTSEKKILTGSLRSFGLRNDIPEYFLKSNWGSLLTGRNTLPSQTITDIRDDRDSRGIWLTFEGKEKVGRYHLLLDREQEVYPIRILENRYGKKIAEITYGSWVTLDKCKQPLEISIAGLDYGTKFRIKLSNVLITNEKPTYRLNQPPGYIQQFLP